MTMDESRGVGTSGEGKSECATAGEDAQSAANVTLH